MSASLSQRLSVNNTSHALSLPAAKRVIIVGGCLAMAHSQLSLSPATIEFARSLGGSGLHVGILGALPIGLLFMQLVAALMANRLNHRKPLWFWVSIVQRLVYLPAALGPWLFPQAPDMFWVWLLVALTAANQGLLHFSTPLWMSWMGDYLPHDGLSAFWGRRHRWTQWTAAGSLLLVAMLFLKSGIDIRLSFALLMTLGVVLGVVDILLFIRVPEPPIRRQAELKVRQVLAAPFRDVEFRSFIYFSCFWNLACMIGAPFISLYLLDYVGMDLFHVLMLWTVSWVGGSMFSQKFGDLVDRHGQRPVLILCTAFKSTVMAALLLAPPEPTACFWWLLPAFMMDAFLNSGIAIANNGFLLKNSPVENRTMFIAAGTAFAGIIGGVTGIAAGGWLTWMDGWRGSWLGAEWTNYHVAFAASLVLRLVSAVLALRVREARAHGTRHVVTQLTGVCLPSMHKFPDMMFLHRRRPQPPAAKPVPNAR